MVRDRYRYRVHYDFVDGMDPNSAAADTAEEAIGSNSSKSIDGFFNGVACFISLLFVLFLVLSRGHSPTQRIGAFIAFAASIIAIFIVYCAFNKFDELHFEWPAEKDLNMYYETPLPTALKERDDDIVYAIGTNRVLSKFRPKQDSQYYDKVQDKIVYCPNNSIADLYDENQVWAVSEAGESSQDNLLCDSSPVKTQAEDLESEFTIFDDKPIQQDDLVKEQVYVPKSEALSNLEALLDEVERDAKYIGCTAAGYRYEQKISALLESKPYTETTCTSLYESFLVRVEKYARNECVRKAKFLYDRHTHRHVYLVCGNDNTRAQAFWGRLSELEAHKQADIEHRERLMKMALNAKRESEERVKAEKEKQEREAKERRQAERKALLETVREEANTKGSETAARTFSNQIYAQHADDIAAIFKTIRAQEAEAQRQREAKLDTIRNLARTCGIEAAQKHFNKKLHTLIPTEDIPNFWDSVYTQKLHETILLFRKDHRKKTAYFSRIGHEAIKETLFNNTFDQPREVRPKRTGIREPVIHCKETLNRHKDLLTLMFGPENVPKTLLRLQREEMKRHGKAWKFLAETKKAVERYNSVFYVEYWNGQKIERICKRVGVRLEEFWDLVKEEQEVRDREKEEEERRREQQQIEEEAQEARRREEEAEVERLKKKKEAEAAEKARLEKERIKEAYQEKARLMKARLEKERVEKELLEQERLEQQRLEDERLEEVRLEEVRLEEVRLEEVRLKEVRLEQERIEKERVQKELQEKEHAERARLEKARLEKHRLEKERREKQRLEDEAALQAHLAAQPAAPKPKSPDGQEKTQAPANPPSAFNASAFEGAFFKF